MIIPSIGLVRPSLNGDWSLASGTLVANKSLGTNGPYISDLVISNDGIHVNFVSISAKSVIYFTMSTPWDVNTLTFVRTWSISTYEGTPTGIWRNLSTGDHVYWIGQSKRSLYRALRYDWDLSSGGTPTLENDLTAYLTAGHGLTYDPTGKHGYIGDSGGKVHQFMPTIQNGSYSKVTYVRTATLSELSGNTVRGVAISPSGGRLVVLGHNKMLYTYPLTTPFDISTRGTPVISDLTALTGTLYGIYVNPAGSRLYIGVYAAQSSLLQFNV